MDPPRSALSFAAAETDFDQLAIGFAGTGGGAAHGTRAGFGLRLEVRWSIRGRRNFRSP